MTPVMQMALIGLIWAASVSLVIVVATQSFCAVVRHLGYSIENEPEEDYYGGNDSDRSDIEVIGTTD